jgi:hypothetical protein
MRAVLRPLFVCGLSIVIAATSLVASSSVARAATRPTITDWPVTLTVQEGDTPTISVTFTDPDGPDFYSYDIFWGDGDSSSDAIPAGPSTFQVTKASPYAGPPALLRLQVTVNDSSLSSSRFGDVIVVNAPPSFSAFAVSPSALDAGQAATAAGTIADPSVSDTHTVIVDWGDGTPTTTKSLGTATTFTTDPHTFDLVGDHTVTATVTDAAGASAVATASVSVRAPNQAPTVTLPLGVTAGSEGATSTLALAFTDPDALDTHTVSVAWGDGSTSAPVLLAAGVFTFEASHVYVDNGTYSVVLTLADSAGHTVTAPASVSPTNVAPAVGSLSLSPSPVVDHQTLTVSGSFTDPGTVDTFTLTVDWGDTTSSTEALAAGTRSFAATHAYNAAGPVTITATVVDNNNDAGSASVVLDVLPSNHAPADLALSASVSGANVTIDGTFTDPDALDTHTVAVSWGDGASASQTLVAGATTFTASHVYEAGATFTVSATVTDPTGASTGATKQVVVTVPVETPAVVLDEMSSLIVSFELDRNTERWLLKKIDDLRDSLTTGNSQVCSDVGTLSHLLAFAERTLTSDQYAALNALATKLKAAAGCVGFDVRPNGKPARKPAAQAWSSGIQ